MSGFSVRPRLRLRLSTKEVFRARTAAHRRSLSQELSHTADLVVVPHSRLALDAHISNVSPLQSTSHRLSRSSHREAAVRGRSEAAASSFRTFCFWLQQRRPSPGRRQLGASIAHLAARGESVQIRKMEGGASDTGVGQPASAAPSLFIARFCRGLQYTGLWVARVARKNGMYRKGRLKHGRCAAQELAESELKSQVRLRSKFTDHYLSLLLCIKSLQSPSFLPGRWFRLVV